MLSRPNESAGGIKSGFTLFPVLLDDYVADDNPVRAVDAFVDGLDLGKLGFASVQPLDMGRPGYRPRTMLKIQIPIRHDAHSNLGMATITACA